MNKIILNNSFIPKFFLIVVLFITGSFIKAQYTHPSKTISGVVLDEKHNPLPFVNIYIEGTTKGTTSNFDGAFNLNIPNDTSVVVVFQYVGYKKFRIEIPASFIFSPQLVILEFESILLSEVIITANKEDPAYPIIRAAIDKRKYFSELVSSFSTKVYMKSNVKLLEVPESFFLIPKDELPDSTQLGLIYLSESMSNYYFQKPNKSKEEMIASKISGTKTGYSFNRAEMAMLSFYNNLVNIGLSERSFISPIANNALFYYQYQLVETFKDKGENIYKIKVIPKRKHDNVFKGYIYIVDDQWNIHSLDLTVTRHSQVDFTDSVHIRQVHVPVTKEIRMPLSLHVIMYFRAFGFKATTNFIGFFTDYKVNIEFPKNVFSNEIFSVKTRNIEFDSIYWEENRLSILTEEEIESYRKGDSIIAYQESDAYLDSVQRVHNKFKFRYIYTGGYGARDKYRTVYYHVHPLSEAISGYNTVEGFNLDIRQHFSKTWAKKNSAIAFDLSTKYSFTNEDFLFEKKISYVYNRKNNENIIVSFGKYNYDYNNNEPLSKLENAFITIFSRDNYLKLYQKSFIKINNTNELFNGLESNLFLEYSKRSPLVNHSDFSLFTNSDKEFLSNNPLNELNDEPAFNTHHTFIMGLSFVFKFNQKYSSFPDRKERYGTHLPILKLDYNKGISTSFSSVNFDQWNIGVYDVLDLKNFGVSDYAIEFGGFLNNSKVYFMDFKHFFGNRINTIPTYQSDHEITNFYEHHSKVKPIKYQSLDYYKNSTNKTYISFHSEHHFNGWIINKVPLLKKTKIQVVSGLNYLKTGHGITHTELYIGFEHIFKVLRLDFVIVNDGEKFTSQFNFGGGF